MFLIFIIQEYLLLPIYYLLLFLLIMIITLILLSLAFLQYLCKG